MLFRSELTGLFWKNFKRLLTESDLDHMHILNLDLDFFLNSAVHHRADDITVRPDDQGLVPWEADAVIRFLEDSLNLRSRRPGKVITHHDEVFFIWRDLLQRDMLTSPFFVCHVDAHSDLGIGSLASIYLHSDFLELPLPQRQYPKEGKEGIDFANYLSFAVGNRWISEIDFIIPPFWWIDIPFWLLPDEFINYPEAALRPETQVRIELELMHAPREKIESGVRFSKIRKSVDEPRVPLNIIAYKSLLHRYREVNWDFVFLSHSPGYAPTASDALIPVIAPYIEAL